jgi:hypothetical protein
MSRRSEGIGCKAEIDKIAIGGASNGTVNDSARFLGGFDLGKSPHFQ